MQYYFELTETTDIIQEFNGVPVNQSASDFASVETNQATIDDHEDPEAYHPDLVIEAAEVPTAKINGMTYEAELIGGLHPPERPR